MYLYLDIHDFVLPNIAVVKCVPMYIWERLGFFEPTCATLSNRLTDGAMVCGQNLMLCLAWLYKILVEVFFVDVQCIVNIHTPGLDRC